jgi:hypothetical protein
LGKGPGAFEEGKNYAKNANLGKNSIGLFYAKQLIIGIFIDKNVNFFSEFV